MNRLRAVLAFWALSCSAQPPAAGDFQISGTVVDHLTSRPLNHVVVEITRTGKDGGDASVLTQSDGKFIFLHVPEGKYHLRAERRGRPFEAFHANGGYSTAIVVDGAHKTDNITFALKTDASINGTVVGDDGDPIRGAEVSLLREEVNNGEQQTIHVAGTMTNSAGRFHFGHLGAGKYYLATQATPWFSSPSHEMAFPVTFYGDTTDGSAARPIALSEGGAADAQIVMRAVPGIHVKLTNNKSGVSLFVAGPGGTRIPSYAMYRPLYSGAMHLPLKTAITLNNESGQAEMINLAAGRYEMIASGRGSMTSPSRTVELANGSVLNLEEPASATVTGAVVSDGQRLDSGLNVLLLGKPMGQRITSPVAPDGTFKFDKVAHGTYSVHLNSPQWTTASVTARNARLSNGVLEVTPGAAPELTIRVLATDTLAKVDGITIKQGEPIAGVMILLLPEDLSRTLLVRRDQSDTDGSFTMRNVAPGKYTLVAIEDGAQVAYLNEAVIKPYLAGGTKVTVPIASPEPIKVSVQRRQP